MGIIVRELEGHQWFRVDGSEEKKSTKRFQHFLKMSTTNHDVL